MYSKQIKDTWHDLPGNTREVAGRIQLKSSVVPGGATLNALEVAVNGDLPEQGPRGGIIWLPRYFISRVAWHVLDHAWEIDNRIVYPDELKDNKKKVEKSSTSGSKYMRLSL